MFRASPLRNPLGEDKRPLLFSESVDAGPGTFRRRVGQGDERCLQSCHFCVPVQPWRLGAYWDRATSISGSSARERSKEGSYWCPLVSFTTPWLHARAQIEANKGRQPAFSATFLKWLTCFLAFSSFHTFIVFSFPSYHSVCSFGCFFQALQTSVLRFYPHFLFVLHFPYFSGLFIQSFILPLIFLLVFVSSLFPLYFFYLSPFFPYTPPFFFLSFFLRSLFHSFIFCSLFTFPFTVSLHFLIIFLFLPPSGIA
jgi:hypothetical protein